MANPEAYSNYRHDLAEKLWSMHCNGLLKDARKLLKETRGTIPYQVSKKLHVNPKALTIPLEEEGRSLHEKGKESSSYEYYKSNEFYFDLADELKGLGGVGLAVGSDQTLDFYNMAGLEEIFNVDIDEKTQIVNRSYLEIGARFHKLFGKYPTVGQYVEFFNPDQWPVTLGMLAARSSTYTFAKKDLEWLQDHYDHEYVESVYKYLRNKRIFCQKSSWIGNNHNLKHTIEGYEKGKIHICNGDITGSILPVINKRIRHEGKRVSLIYVSNAPVCTDETIKKFSQLPIYDATKIIFSRKWGPQSTKRPFDGILDWTMYVFSPKEFNECLWPNLAYDASLKKEHIAEGCFRLEKK